MFIGYMLFWITKWKWRDVTFELNEGSNWLIILESEIYVLFFIFQYYFEPHETKLDELYIEFLLCRAYDVSLTFKKIGLLPYLNKSQEEKKVQSFTLQNLDLANIFWAIRDMSLEIRLLKLYTSCTIDIVFVDIAYKYFKRNVARTTYYYCSLLVKARVADAY